jgi:predicted outer membrane protein
MNTRKTIGLLTAALFTTTVGLSALGQTNQTSTANQNVDRLFLEAASGSNAFEVESSRIVVEKGSNAALKTFAQKMITDHTRVQQTVMTLMSRVQGGATGSTGNTGGSAGGTTGGSTGNPGTTTGGTSGGTTATPPAPPAPSTNAPATNTPATPPAAPSTGSTSSAQTGSMLELLPPDKRLVVLSLNALQGATLDRAYAIEQIAAHEASIRLFRFASTNAQNADVKSFATQTLPALQQHYAEIVQLSRRLSN